MRADSLLRGAALAIAALLAACGDSAEPAVDRIDGGAMGSIDAGVDAAPPIDATPTYSVGGAVRGLSGRGLVLRNGGDDLPITADGAFAFATRVIDRTSYQVTVAAQPTAPRQTCSVTGGRGDVDGAAVDDIEIACTDDPATIGGMVHGLVGTGLTLRLNGGVALPVPAGSERFIFPATIANRGRYEVTLEQAPRGPSQTCAITGGTGDVDGADVDDVKVSCATDQFTVGGTVTGVLGKGLVLHNRGGDPLAIDADGSFTFATAAEDLSDHDVTVAAQPSQPDQVCDVVGGAGRVEGGPVTGIEVVCAALGELRITEVGSCFFNDGSCWFEVENRGARPEDLATYAMRSYAALRVSPWDVFPARRFTLPSLVIEPGARALVRGRTSAAVVDGPRVVHVGEGDQVPYWSGGGFIELVSGGRTIDFVSWGADEAPTTAGGWSGSPVDPMPSAPAAYGYVLARDLGSTDTDAAADWALRAFATPAGPNDVTSDDDDDLDGVPDQAEVPGATYAGVDLYAMGARQGQRDLFVEVDRMRSADPGLTPRREALDAVVAVFAAHHITLHVDAGDLFVPGFDPGSYNLGGGGEVPFAPAVTMGAWPGYANFYAYKAAHFDVRLSSIAHYLLFGSSQRADGSAGSSGYAEIVGNDILITLGNWGLRAEPGPELEKLITFQAGTIMHELGHNLGLDHGGGTNENYKPNYRSVMNYMYQFAGLPVIGGREGDRYFLAQLWSSPDRAFADRCAAVTGIDRMSALERGPLASHLEVILDYSDGSRRPLDEAAIDERAGLGAAGSAPIDYDCSGAIDASIARDLNGGLLGWDDDPAKGLAVLEDHDDWSNLVFVFARQWGGIGLLPQLPTSSRVVAPLLDDRQPAIREDTSPRMLEVRRR